MRTRFSFFIALSTGLGIALWLVLACQCAPNTTCPNPFLPGGAFVAWDTLLECEVR